MEITQPSQADQTARFVHYVVERCKTDKGLAARLRRADNPATEYQSWDVLALFGVDLESEYERVPYAAVAAAIARSKGAVNGKLSLGAAIASCFSDGNKSDQAKARLRRLLACDSTEEVCKILRPLFSLIESRVPVPLDYAILLRQLRWFERDPQRTRAIWAQAFYAHAAAEQEVLP
ncbi:type I-E CRISPR-associated protein Cse2/CasB [Janthinobacterium sp. BJB412]|nr:type I-E CRISPR-associated protein Cse2/CasB [Janthinobacterium sp. BJB412]